MRPMSELLILERELYTVAQASRLLNVPPSTLRWWLDGGPRGGRVHEPVLRAEPSGSSRLTWGEFVEAFYLRGYRRDLGVSLQHLRKFIGLLREQFDVPYPLAHFQPFVGVNSQLVIEAQERADLEPELWLYAPVTGAQPIPSANTAWYLTQVAFAEMRPQHALRVHPLGREKPVVFDPDYSFGEPTVRGIRTEVLVELVEAGELISDVADEYQLSPGDIRSAIAYEFLEDVA